MKQSGRAHPPTRIPTALSAASSSNPPARGRGLPQWQSSRPLRRRRRCRSPAFPGRRLGWGGAAGGRRTGPNTPLLRWKFDDAHLSEKPGGWSDPSGRKVRRRARGAAEGGGGGATAEAQVSARKLAAGIWQLRVPEFCSAVKGVSAMPFHERVQPLNVCKLKSTIFCKSPNAEFRSPVSLRNQSNGILSKIEHSMGLPNAVMERATKWDPGSLTVSDEVMLFYGHLKHLEDQQATTNSVVSALWKELEQARARVNELESGRRLSKRKVDHFLRKLAEEKASWQRREHEKVRAIIDDIKDDLSRERKNVQRMEIMNSKLVHELAEAKLSAKRYLQDYEKERKARELLEEVCDELAKEIGEDKAEVDSLKKESLKIKEEVEEERKMLQMAEVWREERVQMKLIDAKLALEEKYSQLTKLQSDIEVFLCGRVSSKTDVADVQEAELFRDVANVVKAHEIKEFVYQPPQPTEDILSVFEEVQAGDKSNERDIEPCYGYSPTSQASKIHTVSPEINEFGEKLKKYANGIIDRNRGREDDSGWETESHAKEESSSNSPHGSDPSVNGICERNANVSRTNWEANAENGKANSELSEVSSVTTRQPRKKPSSIAKLWRTSCPSNGENYRIISVDAANGGLSNGNLSPDLGCGEAGPSPRSVGRWSSPDSVNPHVTRGMKGCIEWPRGTQKQSLKSKILDARIERQKIQLRHVLKQKI